MMVKSFLQKVNIILFFAQFISFRKASFMKLVMEFSFFWFEPEAELVAEVGLRSRFDVGLVLLLEFCVSAALLEKIDSSILTPYQSVPFNTFA